MLTSYKFAPNLIVGGTGTDLKTLNITYKSYETDVLAALDKIWEGSWTGTSIIQAIAEKPGIKVVITPYLDGCNASSNPYPKWASAGEIHIEYRPSAWEAGQKCVNGPGKTPDAVLLHELVHAYRQMNGFKDPKSLFVSGFLYETEEEFYAVLLTNIHMSASNERVLRRDHGNAPLYSELSTSEPFLKTIEEHIRLVQSFIMTHLQLCQNHVRKDQCVFNPIDYFLKNGAAVLATMTRKPCPGKTALEGPEMEEDAKELVRRSQARHLGTTPPATTPPWRR